MCDEQIRRYEVTIPDAQGRPMYGVVTVPRGKPSPPGGRAVVFCQTGLQCKGGVGDYFRWLADALAAYGLTVVRFDQRGTGDSPGQVFAGSSIDAFFNQVEAGGFLDDTRAALRWTETQLAPEQIYLWGQCDGAVTAVLTCAEMPRSVAGLMLLAMPVLYSVPQQTVREMDAEVAMKGYLKKILRPASYLRLLRGKSDWRLIRGSLRSGARRLDRIRQQWMRAVSGTSVPDHERFNWEFWGAFQRVMKQHKPVLFLLCEIDNETPDFDHEFRAKVLDRRPDFTRHCTITRLPRADHSLVFEEGRVASREAIFEWLKTID